MKDKLAFIGKDTSLSVVLIIFLVSFIYRFYGLLHNHPFWVDEFSSSIQAQLLLKHGIDALGSIGGPPLYIEERNILTHFLIAIFFNIFGLHEWVARLPSVIAGSMVPVFLFFLANKIFETRVAIVSSIFATFSYFEITWSRQARGYMLQQLLVVVTLYVYARIHLKRGRQMINIGAFFILICLGLLTHPFYLVLLSTIGLHFMYISRERFLPLLKDIRTYILFFGIGMLLIQLKIPQVIISSLGHVNNLWYYHSFLWREYGVVTVLSLIGIAFALSRRHAFSYLIVLYVSFHLIVISFLFGPYVTRYLNPIFPLLILFSGYAVVRFSDLLISDNHGKKRNLFNLLLPVFITLLIIANGNLFVTKPKSYYSVNHTFREIALIDYNQVYDIIKKKGNMRDGNTAVIDTWLDRMHWYMGVDYMNAYEFTWKEKGLTNGLTTGINPYTMNKKGMKVTTRYSDIGVVQDIEDLKKAMKKYPKGFIFIDDSTLPKDVIDYANKNFKKELYLDHYPLDDNPYSVWPATLYSWGIE